ncbi:hypothetical protein [Vibrio splendidus]|uniref:hypothetical protein n=1 Tax=Vibrio splendidus TaxID=29497 RepID=UPI0015E775E1|nr:hypothetical protein [Vibrio splendidus]MBT9243758.1 hypothetical protein [Vibrio splendidus]
MKSRNGAMMHKLDSNTFSIFIIGSRVMIVSESGTESSTELNGHNIQSIKTET